MFALYDKIIRDIETHKETLTEDDIDNFISNVPKFTTDNKEVCFALIRNYQIQNETSTFILPYGAKHMKKGGIRFNFKEFPGILQKILICFNKTLNL